MGLVSGLLKRVTACCEASDTLWLLCRKARPRLARWSLVYCLVLCEVTSLLPPPPSGKVPALRWVKLALWSILNVLVTIGNQVQLLAGARNFMPGLSTISQMAFLASTVMTSIQPLVVLFNSFLHLTAMAPSVAGLVMSPLRNHVWFVLGSTAMAGLLLAKHTLYFVSNRKPVGSNLFEFFASLVTYSFDTLVFFLCLSAEDKLHDVNVRLSAVGRGRPELRPLVLETAARQYERTADQISSLGDMGTMGLPLACNSIRHRVKMVTDAFLVYRSVEKRGNMQLDTMSALLLQLSANVGRVLTASMAGDRLYRESKRTNSVLGAVDSIRWPVREKLLVGRLLRNSHRGVRWSMGGLAAMDHSFLLSVIGSTVTYLVVLMQYKDPVADDILTGNGTVSKISRPVPP